MSVPTILWPTDLSHYSLKAWEYVESLAKQYEARVILFYVGMELSGIFPSAEEQSERELQQRVADWELQVAEKHLQQLCNSKLQGCPYVQIKTVVGEPVQEILKIIDQENVDLVVMPTKGRSMNSKKSDYLGSVAQRVIRLSPVPVYVVNPETDED